MAWSPTRVNASANAIRAAFENNDLDAMGSQDGCCTKSGNAGTDYDNFLLRRREGFGCWECLPLLVLTHNSLSLCHGGHRFFRVSTILQLLDEPGLCHREQAVGELKNGRRTTGLLGLMGGQGSDVEMLSHPELTSRHSRLGLGKGVCYA